MYVNGFVELSWRARYAVKHTEHLEDQEEGLQRGRNGLELYCMAEVPGHVILRASRPKERIELGMRAITEYVFSYSF